MKINVVIVDDSEITRTMLEEILQQDEEIEVIGLADDGNAAISVILEKKPDVVLLDLVMPKVDGIGVMERVNAEMVQMKEKSPAFIVISAAGSEEILSQAIESGASYYILKPFDIADIIARIKRVGGSRKTGAKFTGEPTKKIAIEPAKKETESFSMDAEVTNLIRDFGVPVNLSGYRYLRDAIIMVVKDSGLLDYVTKSLYPVIAKEHKTTASRVERSIRHAIQVAWTRADEETTAARSQFGFSEGDKKPTNTEFIALLSDKVRLQYNAYLEEQEVK